MTGFVSDNVSGVHPAILDAIIKANSGYQMPYGADDLSKLVDERYSEIFDKQVVVLPCVTGTAANSLALALFTKPYNSVSVYADSHVYLDECNAPGFFSGGARQVRVEGPNGKMDPAKLDMAMALIGQRQSTQPSAISVSQTTELGTVYGVDELQVIAGIARKYGQRIQMDGARFANALIALNCQPADITWKAGIDVLAFGATKNGCMAAEAIVIFDTDLAVEARYRLKQSGQVLSKQRFLSAQLLAYVDNDLWLANARHANAQAAKLAAGLSALEGVALMHEVSANMMFVKFSDRQIKALQKAGIAGYVYDDGYMRLVCSWASSDEEISRFLAVVQDQA